MEIVIAVVVIVAVGAYFFIKRADTNKDGKVDAAEAKVAVKQVEAAVKTAATKVETKVKTAAKKAAVRAKTTTKRVKSAAKKTK